MKKIFPLLFLLFSVAICAQSVGKLRKLGIEAFKNHDFETAKTYYLKVLDKGKDTWETYTILGDCEFWTKNPEKALEYYQLALEKNPFYSGTYLRLGSVYTELKKPDEAIRSYRKMTISEPNNPAIYRIISKVYYENGKFEDALKEIYLAESFDEKSPETAYGKSLILLKMNRINEMCISLNAAKGFSPEVEILTNMHCNKVQENSK